MDDRRRHRRAPLRLRIRRMDGLAGRVEPDELWTRDISAGGLYFDVDLDTPPPLDAPVHFELTIPPGEGYSHTAGVVRGAGRVVRVRADDPPSMGLAVEFTRPLAMRF